MLMAAREPMGFRLALIRLTKHIGSFTRERVVPLRNSEAPRRSRNVPYLPRF
jgi:hypothetical protein